MGEERAAVARKVQGLDVTKLEWPRLLHGATVSAGAHRVAMVVWAYTDADGTSAFPGNARIAKAACMSVPQAKRNLAALVDAGWLIRVEMGGTEYRPGGAQRRASVYRLGPGPRSADAPGIVSATGGAEQRSAGDPGGGALAIPSPGIANEPGRGSPVIPHQSMYQVIDHQDIHQVMSAMGSPTPISEDRDPRSAFEADLRSRVPDLTIDEAEDALGHYGTGKTAYVVANIIRTARKRNAA